MVPATYLLAILRIQQQPANLDDLGRVLCHVYTMLITSRGHMNDQVAVDVGLWCLTGGHGDVSASEQLRRMIVFVAV